MSKRERLTLWCLLVMSVLCLLIWSALLSERRSGLQVSFLNVGQGDAVLIVSPTGRQVLIDGGPGSALLRELPKQMPWYDRSLDLVLGTHADLDHIGGLIELLPRYRVANVLVPSTRGESDAWGTYLKEVQREHAHVLAAMRGERVEIGGGAYLEVLFPDRALPNIETNTGCVVTRLVYGATSFMLPCDSPDEIEQYLVLLDGVKLKSDVLKAGHHGSKTSSSSLFIGTVDPAYVVFSRGCDNTYGHPSPEIVDRYKQFGITAFDTCTDGTITFASDGRDVERAH